MDLTTEQLYALIGIALFELIAGVIIYVIAKISGFKSGRRSGYRTGIEVATDELHEMITRCTSAERLLTDTRNELRRVEDKRDQHHRNAREAIEELSQQLEDAQVLNDKHAALLCEAAHTLSLAARSWRPLNATLKADAAASQANQLRDLAAWLKPQTQPQHMERAA
jgi:uncharacterized protein (DUF3084 family)